MGFFDNLTSFVEHYLVSLVVLRDLRNYGKNKERSHILDLIKTRVLWRGCNLTKKIADYSPFEHFQLQEASISSFTLRCQISIFRQLIFITAIPYRVSTGPEQGFPCVLFPSREKPIFITGIPANENKFFPVRKSTQGKPCFHYRDGFAV